MNEDVPRPLSGVAGLAAGTAGIVALFGTYWDDAWHTDRGRDDFFIAPHVTLYTGVMVSGLVTGLWLLRGWVQAGGGMAGARALLRQPAALLALAGAAATLASAPVDTTWHELYGRDAVLWSPPHMLGVAGSAAMSVGLLAWLPASQGTWVRAARRLLGAGVLGSLMVPVLEFDSDVAQFAEWTYWPATTAGLVLCQLVVRDLVPGRWAFTAIAAAYTAVKAGVVGLLAAMDHSGTLIAPVLLVALADDALARRGHAALPRALATAVMVPPVWAVAVMLQSGQGTIVPAEQVVSGVLASLAAAGTLAVLTGHWRPTPATGPPAVTTLVLALSAMVMATQSVPSVAWAHDPGQGGPAGTAVFFVARDERQVSVSAELRPTTRRCADLRPQRAIARRAGQERAAPLALRGCTASFVMTLPERGRWFLYLTLSATDTAGPAADSGAAGEERLEAWVPLADGDVVVRQAQDLYVPRAGSDASWSSAQLAAGVLQYAVIGALLVAAVRLARRAAMAAAAT